MVKFSLSLSNSLKRSFGTERSFLTNVNNKKIIKSRRGLFYVPGSSSKFLEKAQTLNSDILVFDLEDSVPFQTKVKARQLVLNTLDNSTNKQSELAVRINGIGSGFEKEDLDWILKSNNLECIVLPKVQFPSDIQYVSERIQSKNKDIRILATIETGLGLLNLKEIAQSSDKLDGFIFGAEDYCADLGLNRSNHRRELLYARSAIVNAAAAYQLQAIDLVCLDFKDPEQLIIECQEGTDMGFTGKQAIHPNQLNKIHEIFLPDKKLIDKAERIIQGYIDHSQHDKGAFELDGKVIDLPVVKWAERILARVPKSN